MTEQLTEVCRVCQQQRLSNQKELLWSNRILSLSCNKVAIDTVTDNPIYSFWVTVSFSEVLDSPGKPSHSANAKSRAVFARFDLLREVTDSVRSWRVKLRPAPDTRMAPKTIPDDKSVSHKADESSGELTVTLHELRDTNTDSYGILSCTVGAGMLLTLPLSCVPLWPTPYLKEITPD